VIRHRLSLLVATAAGPKTDARRRKQNAPVLSIRVWPLLALAALLVGVIASGISVVKGAQELRSLHTALDQSQKAQDRLLAEHSRLLLERSTFAGLQTVEVVATQELQMAFPAEIKEVVP
jgi:cell division protein FtsL